MKAHSQFAVLCERGLRVPAKGDTEWVVIPISSRSSTLLQASGRPYLSNKICVLNTPVRFISVLFFSIMYDDACHHPADDEEGLIASCATCHH